MQRRSRICPRLRRGMVVLASVLMLATVLATPANAVRNWQAPPRDPGACIKRFPDGTDKPLVVEACILVNSNHDAQAWGIVRNRYTNVVILDVAASVVLANRAGTTRASEFCVETDVPPQTDLGCPTPTRSFPCGDVARARVTIIFSGVEFRIPDANQAIVC